MNSVKFEIIKDGGFGTLKVGNKLLREIPKEGRSFFHLFFPDILLVHIRKEKNDPEGNLYGINADGEIVWEFNKNNYLGVKYSFLKPYQDENKKLWIGNFSGKHYQIDHETGEVIGTKYKDIDYEYSGKKLRIDGKTIKFKEKIDYVFPFRGKMLIVLLENPLVDGRRRHANNVYAINDRGKVLWKPKFEVPKYIHTVGDQSHPDDNLINKLYMYDTMMRYIVEPETGEILADAFVK